jgi:hypothetical protein
MPIVNPASGHILSTIAEKEVNIFVLAEKVCRFSEKQSGK